MKNIKYRSILSLTVILIIAVACGADELKFKRLSAPRFFQQLEQAKNDEINFNLLDIRTKPEFDQGHIAGAGMLDFYSSTFVTELKKLDRTHTYFIYCRSGNRTGQALKMMQQLGFYNVTDLKDGINSWIKAGYKVITE